ncbi:MerR family transcriptional regulator [Agrobacterium sp. 22-209-1]
MQDGRMPFESHGDEDKPNLRISSFLPDISLPSSLPAEPVPIADMANIFGVTHRTLHFYEEKALLTSKRIGQMRVYTHRNVQRMAVINVCREVGISVAAITEIMEKLVRSLSQEEADDIFHAALRQRKRELTAELSTLQRQAQQIEELLVADTDADGMDGAERAPAKDIALTDTERKCLELMAEGYAPVRLARALGLSGSDLHVLEATIIGKFNASNRFQAVAKAVLVGVIRA